MKTGWYKAIWNDWESDYWPDNDAIIFVEPNSTGFCFRKEWNPARREIQDNGFSVLLSLPKSIFIPLDVDVEALAANKNDRTLDEILFRKD